MKVSSAILAGALYATAVFAAPGNSLWRRDDSSLSSQPPISVGSGRDTSSVDYFENWAGVILSGSNLTSATGTFTVPAVSVPAGGNSSTSYTAAVWVGLGEGAKNGSVLFQTGIYATIHNGVLSYSSWAWWLGKPESYLFFSGISFNQGDVVTATVTGHGVDGGTATLINHSTGKTVSHTFANQTAHLTGATAEWIMEDPATSKSMVPFPAYKTVVFTNATAIEGSKTVGAGSGTVADMVSEKNSSKVISAGSISGPEGVTVTYKG